MQPLKIPLPGRQLSVAERNAWTRAWQLAVQKIKDLLRLRSTFGDRIRIRDEIRFYWGSPEEVEKGTAKLFRVTKGHIVNTGLHNLASFLTAHSFYNGSSLPRPPSSYWTLGATESYMRVGTGGAVTTGATTTLTAQQDTAPNGQSGSNTSPAGTYRISWIATWNAGTLPNITITEVGLFLFLWDTLKSFNTQNLSDSTQATRLFSRLSAADGDFTEFAINTAVPLTIEWRLIFEFA